MSFRNRIRLPLQLHSAQFPEERQIFRKANGQTKTMSVTVRKTYELETDYMPEHWHQRLKIALAHDEVIVEGERYLGSIAQEGDYNIEWPEGVLHYPTAKAGVKVQVTPFDATNANCQTCEEFSQLDLENDEAAGIYGEALEEDQDYTVDLAGNDSICCYPALFSLTSFNSDYLTSASIDPQTGELTIHTGTPLVTDNGVLLATYRVTCPDGSYDEANVTADVEGSIIGCTSPSGTVASDFTSSTTRMDWNDSGPGTDYYWELYKLIDGQSGPIGTPVQTGTTTDNFVDLTGLSPATQYWFQVRVVCYGSYSNWNEQTFNTSSEETGGCGMYELENTELEPAFRNITYTNCAGISSNIIVFNQSSAFICALENSPGDPVSINAPAGVFINYQEPC